nr:NADH dehydrogenase subunit 6 [Eremiaphila sp.]
MLMTMMISISTMLSIMFLFMNHPLSMGLILLLQTICMCLISGFMFMSFWFSYILVLIYLGGMLVLFMYVTSLASNEMFSFSKMITLIIMLTPIMILIINIYNNFELNNYESLENYEVMIKTKMMLLKLYNNPTNNLTILIASYLFLTLIAIVKIINIFKGPLRQMK